MFDNIEPTEPHVPQHTPSAPQRSWGVFGVLKGYLPLHTQIKEVTVVLENGWRWKKLPWFERWRKVWMIERIHPEYGTKWYYDGSKLTMPFDNYPHRGLRLRYRKACRTAQHLAATYPNHQITVRHESECK